ncbi:hypothetical protein EIP91_001427 [Steccherinum ochraceum]|uniref:Protein kinase domain-containing protein n=1 Tax=Steccherinum ochraceum TaxID=92696 RepID=A0A4R0RRB3_9APHY|nr:hypothetical protein EIP91_001427 [Steccherinum ochraceum]
MPTDIDPAAQSLNLRMLEKDVTVQKRITIPEILRHPFYTNLKLEVPSKIWSATLTNNKPTWEKGSTTFWFDIVLRIWRTTMRTKRTGSLENVLNGIKKRRP